MYLYNQCWVECIVVVLAMCVLSPQHCMILGRHRAHPFGHTAHVRYPVRPRDHSKPSLPSQADRHRADAKELPITDDASSYNTQKDRQDTVMYYKNSYGAHMGDIFTYNSKSKSRKAHIEEPYIQVFHTPSHSNTKSKKTKKKNNRNRDYPEMPTVDFQRVRKDEVTPVSLQAVPVTLFEKQLHSVRTYHDVLRIFYGNHILTDDIIDSMMENNAQPYNTPYGTMVGFSPVRRPRIGDREREYFSTSFSSRNMGTGILQSDMLLHDSYSSSSVMSKNKGSMSDIMLSDDSVPQRKEHKSRTNSNNHRTRNRRRRKQKGKGRKRRKGMGRKRFKKELAAATEHLKEVESLGMCRHPTPVVKHVRNFTTAANIEYFPRCTILYECRADSGCCNDTSVCSVKTSEKIKRSFFRLEYQKVDDEMVMLKGAESFTLENHTECECKPLQQLPTCKPCPDPFVQRTENTTECSCECFDGDSRCLRIKKGRQPLEEDALRCIKEDKCQRPKCQNGPFSDESVRSGMCPRHRAEDMTSGHLEEEDHGARGGHGFT